MPFKNESHLYASTNKLAQLGLTPKSIPEVIWWIFCRDSVYKNTLGSEERTNFARVGFEPQTFLIKTLEHVVKEWVVDNCKPFLLNCAELLISELFLRRNFFGDKCHAMGNTCWSRESLRCKQKTPAKTLVVYKTKSMVWYLGSLLEALILQQMHQGWSGRETWVGLPRSSEK